MKADLSVMVALANINVRAGYGVDALRVGGVDIGFPVLVWGQPLKADNGSIWRQCSAIGDLCKPVKGWIAEIAPNKARLLSVPGTAIRLASPVPQGTWIAQFQRENPEYYQQIIAYDRPIRAHNGIDFSLVVGSTLFAADDGLITCAAWADDGLGHRVKIQTGWGEILYAHLSKPAVTANQRVQRGQIIGFSGNSGRSTGPHLHFGVRVNPFNVRDGYVGYCDPLPFLPIESFQIPPYMSVVPVEQASTVKSAYWVEQLPDDLLLALLIWSEARGESTTGQLAVAHVVLNRASKPCWWGDGVRSVILKDQQFSWFNEKRDFVEIPQPFIDLARSVLAGKTTDPTEGATHFHAAKMRRYPYWRNQLKRTAQIGGHIFYR